jgi:hypothetical protein
MEENYPLEDDLSVAVASVIKLSMQSGLLVCKLEINVLKGNADRALMQELFIGLK